MARRKNLLEAFQKKSEAPPPPAGAPVSSGSLGPLFEAPPARAGRGGPPRWLLFGVGLVIAFALGFALGRRAPPVTQAAGDAPPVDPRTPPQSQTRAFQEPPAQLPAPSESTADKTAPRIEESALFEPANLYTVVVASYSKSNQDLAFATYYHLRDAKLAVFPPVESRNLLVVLVGAAPTSAELAGTEAAVRALSRDGKKKDYADAYRARIDTLIPRPKDR